MACPERKSDAPCKDSGKTCRQTVVTVVMGTDAQPLTWCNYYTILPMPILKRFNDCRIAMYPRDHAPPHVHVEFRDGDRCTVEIETLAMAGRVRPKAKLTEALVWIAENRSTLHRCWKEIVS